MKQAVAINLIVISAVIFGACNQGVKKERLKQLDSLGTHLNHVREIVESVDSQQVANRLTEIDKNSMWVFDNINDTLSRKPGMAFGDYLRTKKFFGKALDRYHLVNKELRFSEMQLANLRADVQNNLYTDEEFENYLESESESIERLSEASEELEASYGSVNAQYERVKPQVTTLLDSIKSVIYASEPIAR